MPRPRVPLAADATGSESSSQALASTSRQAARLPDRDARPRRLPAQGLRSGQRLSRTTTGGAEPHARRAAGCTPPPLSRRVNLRGVAINTNGTNVSRVSLAGPVEAHTGGASVTRWPKSRAPGVGIQSITTGASSGSSPAMPRRSRLPLGVFILHGNLVRKSMTFTA